MHERLSPLAGPAAAAASLLWLTAASPAHGQLTLTPGNLVVVINDSADPSGGSSSPPPTTGAPITAFRYLIEVTNTGGAVQFIAEVPTPTAVNWPETQLARDVVVGPGNALHLFNGTSAPVLGRLDLNTFTWTEQVLAGWDSEDTLSSGGLTRRGDRIFASDAVTAGAGALGGIDDFDASAVTAPTRFAASVALSLRDVNLGLDDLLYALETGPGLTSLVHRFDPLTGLALGALVLPAADYRAVAAGADGSVWLARWDGIVDRFSAAGVLLASRAFAAAHFSDLDLSIDGRLALGTGEEGEVLITDENLDPLARFRVTAATTGGAVFTAWVPASAILAVPESGALAGVAAAGLAGLVLARRIRRR